MFFGPFFKTEAEMGLRIGQLNGASNAVRAVLFLPTPPWAPTCCHKEGSNQPTTNPVAAAGD
jgi:hypothetical protein